MLFSSFAQYLQKLESQPARLAMTETLANLFSELDKSEIKKACYLLEGTLVPAYEVGEFQLSTKMVVRALASLVPDENNQEAGLFGEVDETKALQKIEKIYRETGDLGETVTLILENSPRSKQTITIEEVYERLREITVESGTGSQQKKLDRLQEVLQVVDANSAKFIIRIILGKLRLGFSAMTMIDALSWAVTGGKDQRKLLEDAYQKRADIGSLAEYYLTHIKKTDTFEEAKEKLEKEYTVQTGIPVIPALCQRLNSSAEIIDKMKHVYVEPKYDGLRVQIHFTRSGRSTDLLKQKDPETQRPLIRVFSRSLEVMTDMFPEVQDIGKYISADEVIFDGEAIGYDQETGKLLPFQQTMNRKRKHDIAAVAEKIPLRFYLYDILALDGKELIQLPLKERKELLKKIIKRNDIFLETPYIVTTDPAEVREFHQEQLSLGLEGAVIKQVDAAYQSGRKGWSWVKIKEAEGTSGKLSDTIDGVIMGYYLGKGARAKFGLGAILVGIYNQANQTTPYLTISKVGTGMTEAQLVEIKDLLEKYKTKEKPEQYSVHKNLIPDIWVDPGIVIEIAADEITQSPTHTAGVALRFPRLVKIRQDKKPEDATSLVELSAIQIA